MMSSLGSSEDNRALGNLACVVLTTPLVPIWTVYALQVLDSYVLSNMPFWMLPVIVLSVLGAFPLAVIATVVGRCIQPIRFSVGVTSVATMFAVSITPDLAAAIASSVRESGAPKSLSYHICWTLLFTLVPVCFGVFISCVVPQSLYETRLSDHEEFGS